MENGDQPLKVSYESPILSDEQLWSVRKRIYHSKGEGYYLIRGFVNKEITEALVKFWASVVIPEKTHQLFQGRHQLAVDAPCTYQKHSWGITYRNPFWSNKTDIVSNEISLRICQLRAQIEGKGFSREIFPTPNQRCVIPRIIITKNGKSILKKHSDYGLDEPNQGDIDLARVQCTLFLTEFGTDYTGTGFIFTKNNGEKIEVEKMLRIKPGDLLIWKYSNDHEMDEVKSTENEIGFVRMLFPPEMIYEKDNLSFESIIRKLKRATPDKIKKNLKKLLK